MNKDKLFNLIVKNIPDFFNIQKYSRVLYIEPSKNGALIDYFREAGFFIDCLEKDYKDYHEAMYSGLYRLVMNEAIKFYDPEIVHDIIIQQDINDITVEDLDHIMNIIKDFHKLFVITLSVKESSISKEELLLKHFKVDIEENLMLAWRKN